MMIASFFITEKLSNKDLEKIAELSTDEMRHILEKNLQEAQRKVSHMVAQVLEQTIERSMEVVERALDKETNEKMRAITEYSDTILESIHKTHNEVMFLYSMLNDKHSELTTYAGNLADLAIHLEDLQKNIQQAMEECNGVLEKMQEAASMPIPTYDERQQSASENKTGEELPETQKKTAMNHNQMILAMYKDGKSAVDIAKELGLGVGEVRLVVGLFREEEI